MICLQVSAVSVPDLKPLAVLSASDTAKSTSMQSKHMMLFMIREVNFTLMTQEKLYLNSYPISTFLLEDFPVSPSQSPEQEKDLTIQEERCFLRLLELLPLKNLSISSSKMFPVCLTTTKAGHLKQSSVHWMSWGMMYAGRYLTAKIMQFHSHEIECSLSDILEDNVPEKYYLSRKQAEKLLYNEKPTQGERIYSSKGLSCTLTSGSGGFGGHSGLYLIEDTENFGLPIKSKTKDGYQIAYPGDSIDTAFSGQNSRRGRVGNQVAHTLTTSTTQAVFYLLPERENDRISHRSLTQSVKLVGRHESNEMDTRVHFIDLNPDPKLTEIARCITARHDSGISNRKAEYSGVFVENSDVLDDNEKFAIAFVEPNGEVHIGRIRKLTPRECWRLQGCTDEQFDKAQATGLSDSRLYKMAGNAVTVNVISEIGKIIKKVDSKN